MNKVILLGRLVKDPELKQAGQYQIATFSMAVNRKYAKQGEERQADFINVQAWGKTAEFITKYFQKGSPILVEGELRIESWDDTEGKRNYKTFVNTVSVEFAGGKGTGQEQGQNQGQAWQPPEDDELPF